MTLLINGSFEGIDEPGEWTRDTHSGVAYGEIYAPIGWTAWWEEGEFKRPECKVIPNQAPFLDPPRICDGDWAWQAFTMFGRQHAGLYQVVENLVPGKIYRLTAKAHAWSAHTGILAVPSADCSAGVGCGSVYLTPDQVPPLSDPPGSDPLNDAIGNFALNVGVGPATPDPFSSQVVWGGVAHVYNGYFELPALEFVAPADGVVTVYLKAYSLWNFKTSDAYWDDTRLVLKEGQPPPGDGRGQPRTQYHRTYVLMPPASTEDDWHAAVSRHFADRRTIGGSADDGGIGDLDERKVVAVEPGSWPGGEAGLRAFYTSYYPGVVFEVEGGDIPLPPPPPPPVLTEQLISLHLQKRVQHDIEFVEAVQPSVVKTVLNMEFAHWIKAASPRTLVIYRQWIHDQGQFWEDANPNRGARRFLETFLPSLEANADVIDIVEGLNEMIATDDIPGIQRTVNWVIAFCEELKKAMGDAVRPGILTAAVGNPQHGAQTRMLIPAAEACVAHNGVLCYHGYSYYPGYDHFGSDWKHHAGRGLESWDVEFRAAGVYPRYILTECGVCATAHAGWKHRDCMDGDLDEYIRYLLELKEKLNEWNAIHGGRCLGATLFTSGGGSKWASFELGGDDLGRLAQALLA